MVSSTLTPKTPNATAVEDLVLRVSGSARDGQVVRLKSPKCTIGSAAQCMLRLRSRSVGRVHCLIVRGPGATVVRRWSPDTRLNGSPFTDALLTPGDLLSVGGIDLEVLAIGDLPGRVQGAPAEPRHERPADPAALKHREQAWEAQRAEGERKLRQQSEQLQARVAEVETQRHQLDAARHELDKERQRLEAERRSCESQQEQWQAERTAAEQQLREQAEQPKTHAAELDARAAELASRDAELAAQRAELGVRGGALDARSAELDARSTGLVARGTELDSRMAELTARAAELDRRANELDAAEARLAAERTALETDRESWEADRAAREAELDRRACELEPRAAEPAAEVELLQEEPEFETPKEEAPVDLAAVFRKIGANPVLPEDEPAEPRPAKFPVRGKMGVEEPTDSRPAAQPTPARSKDEEDDSAIDDYMAQLLHRMRSSGDQRGAPASKPAAGPPRTPAAAPEEPGTAASDAAPQALPPGRRKPAKMSPMAVAPEKHGGLSAMRELANMSAQTALHKHARGQTKMAARGKLVLAATGLLVGGLLLALWLYWEAGSLTLVAAMAGFAVAVLWGVQYAFLTGRLIVTKGRIKWTAKPKPAKDREPARAETTPAAANEPPPVAAEPAPLSPPDDGTPTLP